MFVDFLNALPGAVAQGLIWGIMAIGVYISYKILDIADLTVDGSICTGGCVCAMLILAGVPAWVSILVAFVAGMLTGVITGLLQTALGVPSILAGILTQLGLYTVNLLILGKSMVGIYSGSYDLLLSVSNIPAAIVTCVMVIAILIVCLWLFFYTEVGLTLKSTGDNPDMSRAQGVNVNRNKVIGLAISNGIVALSGALLAQYKGSANITDGSGAIVTGLAAIFIGLSVSMKIKPNFVVSLIGVVFGGVVYYTIYTVVIVLGVNTDYLKMLSATIVVAFLAVPYLKTTYFKSAKAVPPIVETQAGGDDDA